MAWLWERQAGKSTTLAEVALFEMMSVIGRTVIYASASLLLAREIVLKARERVDMSAREIIAKDARILHEATARFAEAAAGAQMRYEAADAATQKPIKAGFTTDDFAELFEQQRLEFRVWHDRTRYSRTQVIAPNVATARGWSGTVLLDEIAFIPDFRELWTAMEPIISTNPEFRVVLCTTPPQDDDTHYSFELLAPPASIEFEPRAEGNWYESEAGVPVHRADARDTHLAGKRIYDVRTGREVTPEDAFRRAINKDGYRVNHLLQWRAGGTAACDLLRLKVAQERGTGRCAIWHVETEGDLDEALAWLREYIDQAARVGLGFDVATTTKAKSNPSVLSIMEEHGVERIVRAFIIWKTRESDVATERLRRVVGSIRKRPGGRARALAVDATNERYFADALVKELSADIPVLEIVSSESATGVSLEEAMNWKEYLGEQYVGVLEDNHLTLPPEAYVRIDHRLVRKDRGRFVCEPDEDGRHGDTFDAGKLALHALQRGGANFVRTVTPRHAQQVLGRMRALKQ
jgi:hypothetical protein